MDEIAKEYDVIVLGTGTSCSHHYPGGPRARPSGESFRRITAAASTVC